MPIDRRDLLASGLSLAALPSLSACSSLGGGGEDLYRISLAQWSLHRTLRAGELDPLDFGPFARREFGIDAVEYVNQFFKDKAGDGKYLGEMKRRCEDNGVRSLLIMIDGEGALADADGPRRQKAIANHIPWIEAARLLGCHSIRVNAAGEGTYEETQARAADSLANLGKIGEQYGINVIVENHGGLSSNGAWLAGVMRRANHPRVGTLPDFGNFNLGGGERYDRYLGVSELMPFAKAVSAKSYAFDERGNETEIDYRRMLALVVAAGYHGYVGIEYEGQDHTEVEGIRLTQRLLETVRTELARA